MASNTFRQNVFQVMKRTVLPTSLVVTGVLVGLRWVGALQGLELNAYDYLIRLTRKAPTDERILVVGVDEADIQRLQQYPLHDGTLAETLAILESYDPRAIGIDIGRDVPQGPPEGRVKLTNILAFSDRIVSACLLSSLDHPGVPPAPGTPPDLVGFADFPEDVGGVVRRTIMISAPAPPPVVVGDPHICNDDSPDNEVWSLSFLLSLMYLEPEGIVLDQTDWGLAKLGDVVFEPIGDPWGGYASTEATDYQVMLNYRSNANAVRQVSLSDVLEKRVDPEWIRDRLVLIGYTSQVTNDIAITPYLETKPGVRGMAGVVIHAQAASQILSAVLDQRALITVWSPIVEGLWILLWALLGGAIALWNKRLLLLPLTFGLVAAAGILFAYALFLTGLWLPVIPTTLSLGITTIAVQFIHRATESGYLQAISEQLKDQLRGRSQPTAPNSDYLEQLVRRAKAIREGRSEEEVWDTDPTILAAMPDLAVLNESPSVVFETPETQILYEQLREQAIQEVAKEQAEIEAQHVQQQVEAQQRQLNHLLKKARNTRTTRLS